VWRGRIGRRDEGGCRSREAKSPHFPPPSASEAAMVYVLGKLLPDHQFTRVSTTQFPYTGHGNEFFQFALTHFYGIGRETAHRICARYQIHDRCRVKDLTPTQLTSITAFLSSPSTAQPVQRVSLASPNFRPKPGTITPDTLKLSKNGSTSLANAKGGDDPLRDLKIETELRKDIRQNISHQRMIGSYVGWRHAMGLPVRGQNTQNNAKTAKKLNRIERW